MKFLSVTLATVGLVSAASVTKKVSYDDWKVYRVNIGSNTDKFTDVVNKLQLETWKGKPATSNVVDVMVPPSQVADFEASTEDIETEVMHENLGLSIADEQSFNVYAGNIPHKKKYYRQCAKCHKQPVLRPTAPGSIPTTRLRIIGNGS